MTTDAEQLSDLIIEAKPEKVRAFIVGMCDPLRAVAALTEALTDCDRVIDTDDLDVLLDACFSEAANA